MIVQPSGFDTLTETPDLAFSEINASATVA